MSKIALAIQPVSLISEEHTQQCFKLLEKHFLGADWKKFQKDLSEKEFVITLTNQGKIVGFSTIGTFVVSVPEKVKVSKGTNTFESIQFDLTEEVGVPVIFSGDTAVDLEVRNTPHFGTALGWYFKRAIEKFGNTRAWYIMLSKGFRTYKAMEFMFKKFAPTEHNQFTELEKNIASNFCQERYGSRFVKEEMLIKASDGDQKLQQLSPDLTVPRSEQGDFFTLRNPNFERGDELVCIANISIENFTRRFQRCFR